MHAMVILDAVIKDVLYDLQLIIILASLLARVTRRHVVHGHNVV